MWNEKRKDFLSSLLELSSLSPLSLSLLRLSLTPIAQCLLFSAHELATVVLISVAVAVLPLVNSLASAASLLFHLSSLIGLTGCLWTCIADALQPESYVPGKSVLLLKSAFSRLQTSCDAVRQLQLYVFISCQLASMLSSLEEASPRFLLQIQVMGNRWELYCTCSPKNMSRADVFFYEFTFDKINTQYDM